MEEGWGCSPVHDFLPLPPVHFLSVELHLGLAGELFPLHKGHPYPVRFFFIYLFEPQSTSAFAKSIACTAEPDPEMGFMSNPFPRTGIVQAKHQVEVQDMRWFGQKVVSSATKAGQWVQRKAAAVAAVNWMEWLKEKSRTKSKEEKEAKRVQALASRVDTDKCAGGLEDTPLFEAFCRQPNRVEIIFLAQPPSPCR